MEIRLLKGLAEAIGIRALKEFGVDSLEALRWQKYIEIDLSRLPTYEIIQLRNLIEEHKRQRGAGTAIYDINAWIAAVKKDTREAKPRTVEQFHGMVTELLRKTPGHRIYKKDDDREVWYPYYVGKTEFHPEYTSSSGKHPAYCEFEMFYEEFGVRVNEDIHFYSEHVNRKTVEQGLAALGFVVETEQLRASYLASLERYHKTAGAVGKQFLARGIATNDLDGNTKRKDSWWYRSTKTIRLDRNDEPARVVIDLFRETDNEERDRATYLDEWFWSSVAKRAEKRGTEDEDDEEDKDLAKRRVLEEATEMDEKKEQEEPKQIEIPIHLTCATFDLRRHTRLRIHIDQLTEYVYDPDLGSKLILPADNRDLVEILLAQKGGFRDIIHGKGGGAIILCAGPPGTGKTLTAEVYAEVTARPLYTVQCSQLGTDPDDLEDELLKVFARSQRWNAILLLDEADVYVAARGSDLTQNAIVGVFLRVLEYYQGVMFLTTNRSDLVDDAILSRCIARISYAVPSVPDQKRIWRALADVAGITLSDTVIQSFAKKHPELSGRDVKNLLKLGARIAAARDEKLNEPLLEFVKRFKPTLDITPHVHRED